MNYKKMFKYSMITYFINQNTIITNLSNMYIQICQNNKKRVRKSKSD